MTGLLFVAFQALGPAANRPEIKVVADALRENGDPEVEALLGPSLSDRESWDRLVAIADEAGAYGLVALDLKTLYGNPDAYADPMRPVRFYDADEDDD